MWRGGKGWSMDETTLERIDKRDNDPNSEDRQRRGSQFNSSINVPLQNLTHPSQVSLYPNRSENQSTISGRDTRKRQLGRFFDEEFTTTSTREVEEHSFREIVEPQMGNDDRVEWGSEWEWLNDITTGIF
jgi:hypothetical protein